MDIDFKFKNEPAPYYQQRGYSWKEFFERNPKAKKWTDIKLARMFRMGKNSSIWRSIRITRRPTTVSSIEPYVNAVLYLLLAIAMYSLLWFVVFHSFYNMMENPVTQSHSLANIFHNLYLETKMVDKSTGLYFTILIVAIVTSILAKYWNEYSQLYSIFLRILTMAVLLGFQYYYTFSMFLMLDLIIYTVETITRIKNWRVIIWLTRYTYAYEYNGKKADKYHLFNLILDIFY